MSRPIFLNERRPQGEHWAIVTTSKTFIPGDERSKNYPGHGYPEHYEDSVSYEYFKTEAEMIENLSNKFLGDNSFGIHVTEIYKRVHKVEVQK